MFSGMIVRHIIILNFKQFYILGDLLDEQKVLKWLMDSKQKKNDIIEYIDRKMLNVLLDDVDHIVVYFCKL